MHVPAQPTEEVFWTWMDLMGGARLDELPPGIELDGDLELVGNPRVKSLPRNLKVSGYCILRDLPNLKEIPGGLEVAEWLGVCGCGSLHRVGRSVRVARKFYLADVHPEIRVCDDLECHLLDTSIPGEWHLFRGVGHFCQRSDTEVSAAISAAKNETLMWRSVRKATTSGGP